MTTVASERPIPTGEGLTFEKVWAMLQETDRQMKERQEEYDRRMRKTERIMKKRQEETSREMKERQEKHDREMKERQEKHDREMKERQEENDREMKKRQEEYDRQMKVFNKRFGDFTNRFGEMVEYMIAPNLREKFSELGLNFPQTSSSFDVADYDNKIFFEIDVFLQNGNKAMMVEIKTKLTTEDVKEHIERLEKMRKYADLHGDKRTFLGAVAGVVITPNVQEYALGQGLYVIEPSGESFLITPPNGQPKEW